MRKKRVAVLGATGMVGRRYVSMLTGHPYFEVAVVTGHGSAGMKYAEAVAKSEFPVDPKVGRLVVKETRADSLDVDLVFSPLPTDAAKEVEPLLARRGLNVITDASPHRMEPDIPLIVPEVNPGHLDLLKEQKKRRRWRGLLVATPNCSAAGLALVLKPIDDLLRVRRVIVTTMQAVSGAGYPGVPSLDIVDNVVPYIKDEEEKVSEETRKMLGSSQGTKIIPSPMEVSAMCHRVATTDGHMESAYIETEERAHPDRVKQALREFRGIPQRLRLPTAPEEPIIVTDGQDRPQVRLDRNAGSVPGMSAVVGRVRRGLDDRSIRLTLLSHNTVRGAAGSTILTAELMQSKGLLD